MEKLKKCPFCGGEISIIKQKSLRTGFKCYKLFHGSERCCVLNDIMIPRTFGTRETAIEEWNRRTQ